jgi:transcriptional regulator with XRE-family HTH domain
MAIQFDWHLTDWMTTLDVSQAELCRRTGYPKAKMSDLVSGKQRYNRDILNELADALHIRPYELLMHPADANAIKRVRADAARIASIRLGDDEAEEVTGTKG